MLEKDDDTTRKKEGIEQREDQGNARSYKDGPKGMRSIPIHPDGPCQDIPRFATYGWYALYQTYIVSCHRPLRDSQNEVLDKSKDEKCIYASNCVPQRRRICWKPPSQHKNMDTGIPY